VNAGVSLIEIVDKSYERFILQKRKKITLDLALSGGQDSMALLHILSQLAKKNSFKLRAIHVHHGLSSFADAWVELCQKFCDALNVEFISSKVDMKKNHPLGIEGQARELRYSALNNLRAGVLVTAHHQQDQIETFLLQLLRGSGLRGLSSMQELDEKRMLWRPFLNVDQALIKDYLINNKIEFAQDESNFNDKFDRNFLRNNILPLVLERFPQALKTINRSINLIAEGFHLNQIIAEKDFHHYLLEDHKLLALSAFAELDKGRLVNLIRWWLSLNDLQMPSQKLINEIIKQVKNKKDDALINIKISDLFSIRTYEDKLYLVDSLIQTNFQYVWKGQKSISLPDNTKIFFTKTKGKGFNLDKITSGQLVIRNRQGGEKFKPIQNQPTRTVKSLLQSSRIPPWERSFIPLLVDGENVVAIPEFGTDSQYQVLSDEIGYSVSWNKQPS